MAVELDRPRSVDEIYLERGEPIEPWRPIMTGDVFAGVTIPMCADHELVMVLSHPCSLRSDGIHLVDLVQALPVGERHESIPLQAWTGNYRVMPLPDLRHDNRFYVARLTEFGMVAASELDLDRRIACLSEEGVGLLQQRFFHNQSRVRIGLDRIHEQSAPNFVELELWEQWNERFAAIRVEHGEDRLRALDVEARSFDALMRTELQDGLALRKALHTPRLRTRVRQIVLSQIENRGT